MKREVRSADTSGMKRSYLLAPVALVLSLAFVAPAGAVARWGTPRISHTVSSRGAGPAYEVVARAGYFDRVVFEVHTSTTWWGDRKLVFHGDVGSGRFEPHYYVLTPDGWRLITAEITSERGYVFGRVRSVADVTIRLVVDVRTMPRWGQVYRHRFPVVAGAPDGRAKIATAIVESSA
jgi:hypothetical protein